MKGIAISFLLFYHCFSKKSRMGGVYVDFAPLSRGTAMMISRCMVQCVGLFAFFVCIWTYTFCKKEISVL